MRTLALLAMALLLATPTAAQAPMDFMQPFQVRVGAGDIPTTAATEPDGWSVEQRLRLDAPSGNASLPIPAGHRVVAATCDCNSTPETHADRVVFPIPAGTQRAVVTLTTSAARTAAYSLDLPVAAQPAIAIVYAPQGMEARGAGDATMLPGASGPHTITLFGQEDGLPQRVWLAIIPAGGGGTVAQPDAGIPWLWLAAAFLAGILLWALLVGRGIVQARSRRQVAQVSAHEAIAAKEPKPVLEARKRALMAALKEVEMAKMNGEMETAAYDTVKADLKKQTVTVMRALEEGA